MFDEEIEKGIEEYKKLQENKKLLLEIKNLSQDVNVKRYIELLNIINQNKKDINISIPSDDVLAKQAFNYTALQTKKSNNIYVFIGYINQKKAKRQLIPRDTKLYKDLETGHIEKVYPFYLNEFKKRHKCIDDECNANIEYDKIRKEFFLSLTCEQQDIAVKKLIKKYATKK